MLKILKIGHNYLQKIFTIDPKYFSFTDYDIHIADNTDVTTEMMKIVEVERLRKSATGDRHEIGCRIDLADIGAHPLKRRYGVDDPRILDGRDYGDEGRAEDGGDLAADEARNQKSDSGRDDDVEEGRQGEREKAPGQRHPEHEHRKRRQHGEVQHGERDVGQLLADDELEARHRRHVEIDD